MIQDSCFQGDSSKFETDMDGEVGILDKGVSFASKLSDRFPQACCAFVGVSIVSSIHSSPNRSMDIVGSGTLRPFTPQASMGRMTVFLT